MTSEHSTDRAEAAPNQPGSSNACTVDRATVTRLAGDVVRSEAFFELLAARVARRTESQATGNGAAAQAYLAEEIVPELAELGFDTTIHDNPESDEHPLLIASRLEDPTLPTVLLYGHGDVQFAHDS
ncbi:hypothetical protein BSP239C_00582 [Brevibacterium sp. 239c]|uniref:hypothetical protein n=1 Tax=Brevibacterium sp. 239c TaxID=1965356 RepID=UPI000C564FCF|nr:hypothetical protein [Brevibacterium sp. 239c]SMX71822.1 hypothetical protein BSP239C_00582 [Brevibacterium sp. 239c]